MRRETRIDWHGRVEKTLRRFQDALDGTLESAELDGLAEDLASSPFHLLRSFKDLTGETPVQCFRRLRLERAVFRLRSGDTTVTREAFEAGFETPEGFSKAFRRAFGIAPQAVRGLPAWNGLASSQAGIHYQRGRITPWFTIEKEDPMNNVKIVQLDAMSGYGIENIGSYWNLPALWGSFVEKTQKLGFVPPSCRMMTVFMDHTDKVPMEKKRSYPAALLPGPKEPEEQDGLVRLAVPAGLYAVIPHFGSHEEIGDTWDEWRTKWLPASGWTIDDARPSLEWYQNGGNDPSLPAELFLTLLCDPVRKE